MHSMDFLYFTEEDTTNHSIKSAEQMSRIFPIQEYNNKPSLACIMTFSKSLKFFSDFCNSGLMMLNF